MRAYKKLAASMAGASAILTEQGFRALLKEVKRGPGVRLREGEFVLCFPYSSGDEFVVYHNDSESVRSLLARIEKAADALEVPIVDDSMIPAVTSPHDMGSR